MRVRHLYISLAFNITRVQSLSLEDKAVTSLNSGLFWSIFVLQIGLLLVQSQFVLQFLEVLLEFVRLGCLLFELILFFGSTSCCLIRSLLYFELLSGYEEVKILLPFLVVNE